METLKEYEESDEFCLDGPSMPDAYTFFNVAKFEEVLRTKVKLV